MNPSISLLDQLAEIYISRAGIKPRKKVLLELRDVPPAFGKALRMATVKAGGIVLPPVISSVEIFTDWMKSATATQLKKAAALELVRMKEVDYLISVRANNPLSVGLSQVPDRKVKLYGRYYWVPVYRDGYHKSCRCSHYRFPGANVELFCQAVLDIDWLKMSDAMNPLAELMRKTKEVWINGPGTDLRFRIGAKVAKGDGRINLPDAEVFTAPDRLSVNGRYACNVPSYYNGISYESVCLEFKEGRIIKATAKNKTQVNRLLKTDEGAHYLGEFALGLHPLLKVPFGDALLDEKIAGSFHIALGTALEEADNGNRSAIHVDLVCIQTLEYGGGEIWFDGVLVRKDGLFVLLELSHLNPERLLAICQK